LRQHQQGAAFTVKCEQCGAWNKLQPQSEWPDVPREVYLGYDNANQVKVYAVPPPREKELWADPYFIRSLVDQITSSCMYRCQINGFVHGEPNYIDECEHIVGCTPDLRTI
jgi:hypothetical protein